MWIYIYIPEKGVSFVQDFVVPPSVSHSSTVLIFLYHLLYIYREEEDVDDTEGYEDENVNPTASKKAPARAKKVSLRNSEYIL